MRRSIFAISTLLLCGAAVACSASGSSATDDQDTDPTAPAVDAGKKGKPVNGGGDAPQGDDDDDDVPVEDGGKDAGKDAASDAGKDAAVDAGVSDAAVDAAPPADAGPCGFSGVLAKYDLSALTGSAAKADATTVNGGIVAGSLVRSGVSPASASGALNASGWPTGPLDPAKYDAFTLTAPAGCAFRTSSIAVTLKASGTGPAHASVATSADAFAAGTAATTAGAVSTLPIVVDTPAGATLEVRIYGYDAAATGGTMRVDQAITVSGALH